MKIFIASDIHGSKKYCDLVIDAYTREKCEKMILLGDILYHGPRNDLPPEYEPKAVIAALNPLKSEILAVRGNCEAEVDDMVLDFPVMAEYALIFNKGRMFFLTHGHKYNEENPPKLNKGDVLINGHTHIMKLCEHDDYIYINPGSVSIPKEGTPRGYIIIDDDSIVFKTLSGEKVSSFSLKGE